MNRAVHRPVYMDNQATTPVDFRVLEAMLPFFNDHFGNPHSGHELGRFAIDAVEKARGQIASLINAPSPQDIVFTSGATESNNIALKGTAHFYKAKKKHLITVCTEHKCVLESTKQLQKEGFDVTYLPVQQNGLISLEELEKTLSSRPDTALVSVMAVNNEIGVIQPLKEIGQLCRKYGSFFHTDAAQAVGKIPFDVEDIKADMVSMSAHKLYGPKGIGAIYIRRRPRVRVEAQMSGGGQERGVRSGTLAAPIIVGFGEAAAVAQRDLSFDHQHIHSLAQRLWNTISTNCPEAFLNGDPTSRYVGNLNVSFPGIPGDALLDGLRDLAVSAGSACTSASLEPSYVLRAIGVPFGVAPVRFGIGRFTTQSEVDFAGRKVVEVYRKLKAQQDL